MPARRSTRVSLSPSPPPNPTTDRPLAVAITGGIGAGKSETLLAFARHGAATVSTDEIVHQLLRDDAEVKRAIIDRLGEGVVGSNGEIDRAAVGRIVFSNRAELAWLEGLLHPRVSAAYLLWRQRLGELPDPPAVCVAEVPLLYESGGERHVDVVVAITASPAVRAARTIRPDLGLREQRLIPDAEKVERADFAYVNDGTLEDLDAVRRRPHG